MDIYYDKEPTQLTITLSLASVLDAMEDQSRVAYCLRRYWLTHTEHANYLSLMLDGRISYLPDGKTCYLHEQSRHHNLRFDPKGRQVARPARVARMVLKPAAIAECALVDKDFELFNNLMRAQDLTTAAEFRIVSGEDIGTYYHEDKHASFNLGSLSGSCMRHQDCQGYFGLYERNPALVRLLILQPTGTDLVIGRALLWSVTDPLTEEPATFMDRVYGTDVVQELFRTHALSQGWWYRQRQSYDDPTQWLHDGKLYDVETSIQLDVYQVSTFPYLDTFKWLDPYTGRLSNLDADGGWELTSIEGGGQYAYANWAYYTRRANGYDDHDADDESDTREGDDEEPPMTYTLDELNQLQEALEALNNDPRLGRDPYAYTYTTASTDATAHAPPTPGDA